MHWLAEMVLDYRKRVQGIEFFNYVKNATEKEQFAWVRHLLHQSYEFPLLLSLRYSLCKDPEFRKYFAIHADEEYGHCDMLTTWMVRHGLLGENEDINDVPPTVETVAALGYHYRTVLQEDDMGQLVGLNAVSEGVAADFFASIQPVVTKLGMGDEYWDLHALVDVEHAGECLEMFPENITPDSKEGKKLAQIVHDTCVLYAYMLNSWIGVRATIDTSDHAANKEFVVA
ncbi:MAG TPA: iron-containing redox enzyme family protein [Bacilli bacterium]|nr:iron-containing redox enzyme family protein [Bacilli bacterium]